MADTPAILDRNGIEARRYIPRARAANRVWQNHFYHGASQDGQTPYSPVRLDGIDQLLPTYDWQTLLSGSRGMYANYGPVRSCCHQIADNAVGNAYLPDFQTESKSDASVNWGRDARSWLVNDWFGISDVRGAPYRFNRNLWLDSVAINRDGDVAYLLTSHATSGLPALQHIPANRILTGHHNGNDGQPIPKGRYKGAIICNGVIKNRVGRTVAYRVRLGTDWEAKSFEDISARDMRLIFDPEWHDQSRGINSSSHALRFIANSLQSHEWEHTALMMLSSIGLIERNPLGLPSEDDPMSVLGGTETPSGTATAPTLNQQTFEGGSIRYFSSNHPGSGLESISGDRPGPEWESFQDRTIRFYCSGSNWPYELVWKSDDINGTTIRNIQQRASRAIRDRQAILDPHARSQVVYALRAAVNLRLLPAPPDLSDYYTWTFRHPKEISIDPGRDTSSEIAALQSGHTSLGDIVEPRGMTEEEHLKKLIQTESRWNELRAEAGLPAAPLNYNR